MTPEGSTTSEAAEFDALEKEVVHHVFTLSPGYAVFLGLHEYDGKLPDLSRAATEAWESGADRLQGRLGAIDELKLPAERRHDRLLLELLLDSPLFDLRDSRDYDRNPMAFAGAISLTPYLSREYAPLAERVEAMAQVLTAVPRLLGQAKARLGEHLPEPFLRLTLAMAGGLPSHFHDAELAARQGSEALGARVAGARAVADSSVTEFVDWLSHDLLPKASQDFALGPERFQRLLWVREGIHTPFSEILAQGRADLERNQSRLAAIAAATSPPASIPDLLEGLYRDHPTAEGLIGYAQGLVEETKRFVRDRALVTIPEPAVCRVEETPSYGRALSTASMNPPGPFDTAGDEGIYYVTPVDPTWSPERQEQWLRSLNRTLLKNITVHEVYPGHYLQFLHFRRRPATLARKAFISAAFTEGWAHYAEQLVIENGMDGHGPGAEVAELHDALLRDCRLIASIGLHTQGMTVEEATQLFMREAHFERLPAEREAIRGTFNPEYFCYTLGKLEILQLREKLLESRFGGSLQAFHDALLSFGSPPVGLLERLLRGAS